MDSCVFPELGFCQENETKDRNQGVEGVCEPVIQGPTRELSYGVRQRQSFGTGSIKGLVVETEPLR